MTYTTSFKEELSRVVDNDCDKRIALTAFLNISAKFNHNITINSETASVIRKIYSDLKSIYQVDPLIKIRIQKRFREKQVYILEVNEKYESIERQMNYGNILDYCNSYEERTAFLKGAFLAGGSITDPKKSGYHLEFATSNSKVADDINIILISMKINSKIVKRGSKFVVYVKAAEEISDIFKIFKTINSLFYFEDIRIYRDHKNMVNRLTNCEIANQEKIIKTGLKQMDSIVFLREKNLLDLLDDKTIIIIEFREKYPDASYQELSDLISQESDYKIGKSGINHKFIKINELAKKYGFDK